MREAIFAGICAVFGALLTYLAGPNAVLGPMQVFPMAGMWLREMSLSGAAGDVAAWTIYGILCALPLAGLLPMKRKRGAADALFVLAALYSLWMWRMLANPVGMSPSGMSGMEEITGMMAAGVLIGLIVGGVLLRLVAERGREQLARVASKTVTVFAMICGYSAGMTVAVLMESVNGTADAAYAAVQGACSVAQTAALVWMLGGTADLIESARWDWFDEVNARLADALATRSRRLLMITVFASLIANGTALLMAGKVTSSNVSMNLPVAELIAAVCCMLLAQFIREGVRIKAENDEFV